MYTPIVTSQNTSTSPAQCLALSESSTDSDGGVPLGTENRERNHSACGPLNEKTSLDLNHDEHNMRQRSPKRGLDWCDRGVHVDFHDNELVPLQQGRFLGPGVQGGVYETTCKGVRLAWKKKYCPKGFRSEERREIEILKKLSHRHIIKLMGTYTHGPFLGLLLWPVAVCDLATFMEDVDIISQKQNTGDAYTPEDIRMMGRLHALCPDRDEKLGLYIAAVTRLTPCFGCLAGAIAFIHEKRIRHKDVKPSNVLISPDGLWLADFGMSSDFSGLTNSQSEAVERGTAKYFAPEVAMYERSGRSADIFSLGCTFVEMVALCRKIPLDELRALRPEQNGSFQANLGHKRKWFMLLKPHNIRIQHLLCEVESMVDSDPNLRPSAAQVHRHLSIIDQFGPSRSLPLQGPCCASEKVFDELDRMAAEIEDLKICLKERDDYIDNIVRPELPSIPPPPIGRNWMRAVGESSNIE